MSDLIAKWHKSIKEIPKESWQELKIEHAIPFFEWDWLEALETSKSISKINGWQPIHLSIWKKSRLISFAPLYLKNHSYGEFIFDQQFVDLANQLNLKYYPKLVGMSPVSPVEGYKFFISKRENETELVPIMIELIDNFAKKHNILSCNFLYVNNDFQRIVAKCDYHSWINAQSLWESDGELNFEEYLQRFNSNQRRNIKRERKSIRNQGIKISTMSNEQINKNNLLIMYDFYKHHCAKWGIWGSKYLSKDFFEIIGEKYAKDKIILFNANRGNIEEPIAMSLCLKNEKMLWGRYWGSKEQIECLHFEVCYYSPINWAINNGIKSFDPGAGGSHKKRRGFISSPRISLHKWYEPRINSILKTWLPQVNGLMKQEIDASNNEVPFKSHNLEI